MYTHIDTHTHTHFKLRYYYCLWMLTNIFLSVMLKLIWRFINWNRNETFSPLRTILFLFFFFLFSPLCSTRKFPLIITVLYVLLSPSPLCPIQIIENVLRYVWKINTGLHVFKMTSLNMTALGVFIVLQKPGRR